VEDYYLLHKPLAEKDGKYSLLLKEFEQEHSFFDQVKLLAIDHDSSFRVAVDPSGKILTYKLPVPALFALDNGYNDLTMILNSMDEVSYEGEKGDFVILDFGKVNSENAKLILRSDWRPPFLKRSIHIQVLKGGKWKEVASIIPRDNWAFDIVDLSKHLTKENLKVRLYFTSKHKLDFVGLDTSEQEEFEVHHGKLVSAVHSTRGNVKDKLLRNDRKYAELIPGEEMKLEFSLPEKSKEVRDFIFYSRGYYYTIEQ
jgi:hypothetical protein